MAAGFAPVSPTDSAEEPVLKESTNAWVTNTTRTEYQCGRHTETNK